MFKLVITNGWSDLNAGDSAIVMSIIKRFEMEYNDKFSVKILSELHEKNKFFIDSIDKIKEIYPNINIELLSSPFYKVYDNKRNDKMKEIVSLFRNFFKLLFVKFNNDQYTKAILEADIIVSKGGHFLHDRKGLNSIIHLFKCLYPIMIANRFNKNYYFIAQSFGPFFDDSLLSRLNKNFVKHYLMKSSGVSAREEVSLKALEKMDINSRFFYITSDYGFLINKILYDSKKKQNNISSKYMVITLRQHKYKKIDGESNYLNTIKELSNFVFDNYNIKSLVVPHVKGPNDFENDIIITQKFESILKNEEKKRFIFNYEYLHAKELVELYSNAEVIVGTRFHSVIFGLCSSIPCIAISYSGYKANIMKQFEMDEFMIDIEDVHISNFVVLKNQITKLIEDNIYYRKKIDERLKAVIDSIISDPVFESIKKAVIKNKNQRI